MYVYVQALDFGRLLRIQVEPSELVRSLKSKIDFELGGNIPEDIIDSLNYLGVTLDCSTPLSAYGIRDSSFLYMGRQLQYQYPVYPNPQQMPQAPVGVGVGVGVGVNMNGMAPVSMPPQMAYPQMAPIQPRPW